MQFKTILLICLFAFNVAFAANNIFAPRIEGTIRGKYEYFTEDETHRFQVRNARFSIRGQVNELTSYKAEIDLSDEGRTRMLDAFIKVNPNKNLAFTIGQQKVAFSTDNLRSPHNQYFANRSFMAKQLINLRDVGASIEYHNQKHIPFNLFAGAYNGLGLYTQDKTMKLNELSYAIRMVIFPENNFQLSLNYNTIHPYTIRMNFYNMGVEYNNKNLRLEAEYLYKNYYGSDELNKKVTHGMHIFAVYSFKTKEKTKLKYVTPVVRYDYMSDNDRYEIVNSTNIKLSNLQARGRLTTGVILSFGELFSNDIRLNYEHYNWPDGSNADSKFVAEFVVKF